MGAQVGKKLEQLRIKEIAPAGEGGFEGGLHQAQLAAIVGQVAFETVRILRRDLPDLFLHPRHVGGAIEGGAIAENDAVLRVEPDQFEFVLQGSAGGLEDFVQHARVEEEGGTDIEAETVGLD